MVENTLDVQEILERCITENSNETWTHFFSAFRPLIRRAYHTYRDSRGFGASSCGFLVGSSINANYIRHTVSYRPGYKAANAELRRVRTNTWPTILQLWCGRRSLSSPANDCQEPKFAFRNLFLPRFPLRPTVVKAATSYSANSWKHYNIWFPKCESHSGCDTTRPSGR